MKKKEGKKKKECSVEGETTAQSGKWEEKKEEHLREKKKKTKKRKRLECFEFSTVAVQQMKSCSLFFFFSFNRIYLRNGIRVASKKNTCSVKKKVWKKKKRSYKKREISWFFLEQLRTEIKAR